MPAHLAPPVTIRGRLCALLAAIVVAPSALAVDDDASANIPNITIRGVMPENPRLTPGAASVLEAETIETLRPYTLHDAFDFVPGVRTIDDDVLGRRSGIGIRGSPPRRSRKTLLLEDGTPINLSTYLDPSSHYTPPMERLERIEVLKGTGHVLHGPLNNHGIVNFQNKRATATPLTTIDLSGGNLATFKRHLMHQRTDGALGSVLAYSGANADGSFDIEEFQYDDFYASFDWAVAPRHDLGISLTYYRERSDYDESNLTPQEFAVAPRKKKGRFDQEFNTFALDYFKGDVVHDFAITDRWSMSTRFFATNADRPRFTVDPEDILVDPLPAFVFDDPDDRFIEGVQGVMVSRDRQYRTYGIENRMELTDIKAAGFDHTLQWGTRFERHFLDDMRSEGRQGELLKKGHRGPTTQDESYQASAVSLFVQDIIRIGDWTVTPGLRTEYYTQNKIRKVLGSDPGPHDPKQTDHNSLLLPSLSFLYQGFEQTEVFANIARGYTPAFARTAESFPLEPETGINSQVGVRSIQPRGVTLEAAGFYNIISDTVVQLPFTVGDANVVLNAADSESYGVDLGLRAESAAFVPSPFNFFAELAYNYTEAKFTEDFRGFAVDGNRVPEVADHVATLTAGFEHAAGWHLSATVSYFGDFYTDPLNTRNLVLADEDRQPVEPGDTIEIREPAVLGRVKSHTLLSARLSYDIPGRDMTVWLQGRNLTDRLYVTDLENGMRPGAERTVMGGVRLRF